MDYNEFRRGKVWLKVTYGPEPDPDEDARYQAPQFKARIAYAPGMLTDEDAGFLATIERVRLAEFGDPTPQPTVENRAQRRARDRANDRADAVPPGKEDRPTMVDFMKRLIVDWDLVADGEPVPVCEEVFREMEIGLRVEIVGTILKDYLERPNLGSLSKLFSAATTANGQTGQTSASEPSSTAADSSPGSTDGSPT